MASSTAVPAPIDAVEDDAQYELIDNVASAEKQNEEMQIKLMLAVKELKRRNKELEAKLALVEKKDVANEEVSGSFSVKFTDISNLSEKDVFSPEFEVGGMKWSLCINKRRGNLCAYLYLQSPETAKCTASYTICLLNNDGEAESRDFDTVYLRAGDPAANNYGNDKFVSFKNLMNPKEDENYYNAEDDSIIMQVDLTVHGSVDKAPVVSVEPKEEKEEEEDEDEEEDDDEEEEEQLLTPKKPSRECACSIL